MLTFKASFVSYHRVGENGEQGDFDFLKHEIRQLIGDSFDYQVCEDFVFSASSHRIQRMEGLIDRVQAAHLLHFRLHILLHSFNFDANIVSDFSERARNPLIVEELNSELSSITEDVFAFEPEFSRYLEFWSNEEHEDSWQHLMLQCAGLDDSSYHFIREFMHLFSDPNNAELLKLKLQELEKKEVQQRASIKEMTDYLTGQNLDTAPLKGLNFVDSFDTIAKYQQFLDSREYLKLNVLTSLKAFDEYLYDDAMKSLHWFNRPSYSEKLSAFGDEHESILMNLQMGLQRANEEKREWERQGIIFDIKGHLQPNQLKEWEETISNTRTDIELNLSYQNKWNELVKFFPEQESFADRFIGNIQLNDEFKEHIEMLDQRRKQTELDGLQLAEQFEQSNINMDEWKMDFMTNPIEAFEKFSNYQPKLEAANQRLQNLHKLDVSFEGKSERDKFVEQLQNELVTDELIETIDGFIQRKNKRNQRHRDLLDEDARKFGNDFRAEMSQRTLAEYEREIKRMNRAQSATPMFTSSSHLHRPRILPFVKRGLEHLQKAGWNLNNIPQPNDDNAVEVAHLLHSCQKEIDSFQGLRKRLLRLEWNKDVELALEVSHRIQDPTQLLALRKSVPQFIQHLASRDVEDPNFPLHLWSPKVNMPVLIPKQPASMKNKTDFSSSLDDAHDAILEAMDPSTTDDDDDEEDESNESSSNSKEDYVKEVPKIYLPSPVIVNNQDSVEQYEGLNLQHFRTTLAEFCGKLGLTKSQQALLQNAEELDFIRRNIAKQVGFEPRDQRIDRMLRIALRCFPNSNDNGQTLKIKVSILSQFNAAIEPLHRWMRHRLEHRHSSSSGVFLQDAKMLGVALQRIPGPGIKIPLHADHFTIPNDLELLVEHANDLIRFIQLPSAGGVMVASS